jgi:F-type H+-transporting ATPase subunit a
MAIDQIQQIQIEAGGDTQNILAEEGLPKEKSEPKEEISLSSEPVFNIGSFTVTNSLLNSWIAVLIIIILSVLIRRKISLIPKGIANWFEVVVEGALKLADSVTGSRDKTLKFFPLVFAFFIFILINNWLGILPGIGSIGYIAKHGGESLFIPYFRGGTADLNTTIALAITAIVASHIFGIVVVGAWKYFNKFVNISALIEIPRKIIKEPTIALVNPIKFFVGIVEIIGEIAKVASLSFRLFGNIFAGEVLLMSIAALAAFIAPIPFMFLEIIVGLVQALVFSILTLVFLTIATTKEEH